jgi:hypothetical protein
MDFFIAAALMAAGFVAGVMNSIAGGGTLVTFPALVFSGLPSVIANATSTVALLPAALSSAAGYRQQVRSVVRWLKVFAPVSLLGGLVGGILLVRTPSNVFDWLVPFLILFATILFMANNAVARFFGNRVQVSGEETGGRTRLWPVAFQFCVALYGGYFGAGIGILMLASLGLQGFKDVHEMNALKVILGFLINVVAALYFIMSGLIVWWSAGVMAVGTILGGYAGAHFAQRIPQSAVRRVITAIGLIIAAVMFCRQIF